ncbi:MAG TPA: hypothetical protein VHC20_06815 [Candidatus Paceibacterota bacterium]|nr:hypothetical protein [Candidatus Paceibacterota bacterium]
MPLAIPANLADKAAGFPESSYGASRATLVLKDGRRIFDVTLAWGGEIVQLDGVRVEEEKQLGFGVADIVDVVPWP